MDNLKAVRGIAFGVILGSLAWGVTIGGTAKAFSQEAPVCGDFEAIRKALKDKLHMVEVAGGIVNDQTVIVILANPEGQWASFALDPSGLACLGTKGEGWVSMPLFKGRQA